ncbi:MAG: phospho-sugar mutase [bacterium]
MVIANDVLMFNDIRENYSTNLPNPLIGLTSRDFAGIAAGVYAANHVKVYMVNEQVSVCSTPELSFYIRYYRADGGLNISASHNHPDDNGAKFFNFHGGQEIPPHDQEMSDMVDQVAKVKNLDYEEAHQTGLIGFIEEEAYQSYIASNLKIPLQSSKRFSTKIAYSPLNGTGVNTCGRLLEKAGFHLIKVEKQYQPDGSFKNVKFRIANPEVRESMEEAVRVAEKTGAQLAVSTDPDADRIGICAPDRNGEWVFFTGNEIGIMIAHYIFEQKKAESRLNDHSFVTITKVTSTLISRIAEKFGVACIGDLLVGFKYIGDLLYKMETEGEFRGVKGSLAGFVLGAEESHGILLNPDIRDKDAAGAALVLADLVSVLSRQDKTLPEYLDEIYKKYGYVDNRLVCTIMEGAAGTEKIKRIQEALRSPENRLKKIAGIEVIEFIDQLDEKRFGRILSLTDQMSRNLLIYKLKNDVSIALRPSGTEPKNKIYLEIIMEPLGAGATDQELEAQKRKAARELEKVAHDFTLKMLNSIGMEISPLSLKVSDLVSLENKKDFGENFLPEFMEKVQSRDFNPEIARPWIDNRLKSYGQDPRFLVKEAMEAFLKDSPHLISGIKQKIEQSFWGIV